MDKVERLLPTLATLAPVRWRPESLRLAAQLGRQAPMDRIVHPEHVVQDWPFPFPPGLGCVTTRQVMDDGEPICSVINFGDGDWLITGGTFGNEDDGVVVCFACLYERHPSIAMHASLKPGFEASLDEDDGGWVITPVQQDDD